MGILNWLRGKPVNNFSRSLPVPSSVKVEKKEIPSDIPPIKAEPSIPIEVDHGPMIVLEERHDEPIIKAPEPVKVERPSASREDPKHLFVSSDEYAAIIEKTNTVRSKLLESEEALQRLVQLRAMEEESLTQWQEQLEGLEKKISYVESVIAKSGGA